MKAPSAPLLALVQGVFYTATGLWSLVDLDSFMAVTGPKTDHWLVKTVGLLIAVIGASLLAAAARPSRGSKILGAGSAAALGGVDVVYALKGRISKIYLADAVVEALLVGLWERGRRRRLTF